ncbi:cytochrome P450 [Halovivax sp.]|uniref:cytochrome P450 n=1 Tax=Halovivax sp. TaxID=1935978 RepID=UPI0025BB4D1D|nr:cytochrome P450 [Halovivax sp.]
MTDARSASDEGMTNRVDDTAAKAPVRTPPGPRGLPLLGSTLSIARDPVGFLEAVPEYGDVARYEAYGREFVVVTCPDLVEEVLLVRSDEFWRGEFEGEFGEFLGIEGVLFAEGDEWHRQRLMLQSAFTPDRVTAYANEMVAETARLVDGWADGEVVDVNTVSSALTLRVLTRSLFAIELDGERAADVRRWAEAMGDYLDATTFGVRALLPSWVPDRRARAFRRATDDVSALVEELVAERRREGADGDDLLSLLARAEAPDGSQLDPTEVRDQLLIFLIAGHETTATALTYACWLLAGDDAAREHLDDELDCVLGGRDPTAADLEDLVWTEAICREAMRCYPPFPFLDREPHEPTTLGGYRIEPGTTVQLNAYGVHRDERWWDDPEVFRPGRWVTDDGEELVDARLAGRPEYAYFPFGGGPRHCLGMRFAMTELQLTLATLARRVTVERVTESLEPSIRVSLDPGTVELRVRKR